MHGLIRENRRELKGFYDKLLRALELHKIVQPVTDADALPHHANGYSNRQFD